MQRTDATTSDPFIDFAHETAKKEAIHCDSLAGRRSAAHDVRTRETIVPASPFTVRPQTEEPSPEGN